MALKQKRHREIITLNIGGCGVNLGQTLTEQYAMEHGISCNGYKEYKTRYDNEIPISYEESSDGRYTARTLMIDLDPDSIHHLQQTYQYIDLFSRDYLISDKNDASNNFAMGYHALNKELMNTINDKIRCAVERCDMMQGFIMNHSVSGGTGSGLGSFISQQIKADYKKSVNIGFQVFHDENKLSHCTQIYNALFNANSSIDYHNVSIILDNKQINNIFRNKLHIQTPQYKNLNHLLCKLISLITAPSRYAFNEVLNCLELDLVPFPRLHFMTTSMSPIIPSFANNNNKKVVFNDDILSITKECADSNNFFIFSPHFNVEKDKYLSISWNYRGNNINQDLLSANESISWLLDNNKICFSNHSSAQSVKFVDGAPPKSLPMDDVINTDKQVSMIANNTWIRRLFSDRILKYHDMLFKQRCYIHHFTNQGMEEDEFEKARENVTRLVDEYLDISKEQNVDVESDEDEVKSA